MGRFVAIKKIISGGQTGADRAAWDAAIECDVEYGGWVPLGSKDENGPIPPIYTGFTAMDHGEWDERTRKNVEICSETLIFTRGPAIGGTRFTIEQAVELEKPFLVIDLQVFSRQAAARLILQWMEARSGAALNVAGPRASQDKQIYDDVLAVMKLVLLPVEDAAAERTEALQNFRHWDIIRWTALLWYLGLSAPATMLAIKTDVPLQAICGASLILGLLGALVLVLIHNTQNYHEAAAKHFPQGYAGIKFNFHKGRLKTATGAAQVVIGLAIIAWLVYAAICGILLWQGKQYLPIDSPVNQVNC